MAEESVSFPQDEALDDLYQPLKLEPGDRRVVFGDEEYEIRAEIEADLFEMEADKITKMSPLRCVNDHILPLLLDDLDLHVLKAQVENRQVRPVDIMKKFSPAIEKLAGIIEARTKTIQKKRRALPK